MASFRLPAALLRRVDEAIAESDGAYADRKRVCRGRTLGQAGT